MRRFFEHRTAFTLTDLLAILVVVVVVGAGVSWLSQLGRTHCGARDVKSLIRTAELAREHFQYAADHRDSFFAPPTPKTDDSSGLSIWSDGKERSYFRAWSEWPAAFLGTYYAASEIDILQSPFGTTPARTTSYAYSCSLTTRPTFWSGMGNQRGIEQYSPVKISEVRFPQDKSIIHDYDLFEDVALRRGSESPWLAAFVVGSAAALPKSLRGYVAAEAAAIGSWPEGHQHDSEDGMHTVDGALGRDR
ncbi:MAG: hypothetical protein WC718_07900 [Phycisphaerales bacterium]